MPRTRARTRAIFSLAALPLFLAALLPTARACSLGEPSTLSEPASLPVSLLSDSSELPPQPTTRVIDIDGRFVTVSLSLTKVIPGIIYEGWPGPSTEARLTLSIQDGALLPKGLEAVQIRFEKLRGAGRIFVVPLTQIISDPFEPQFELDSESYTGDLGIRVANAQRIRAIVRLEVDGRIIRVPMGTVPIHTLALP